MTRRRVVAYIGRDRHGRRQLLVFDHRDHPEVTVQVPAGRPDPAVVEEETPEEWEYVVGDR